MVALTHEWLTQNNNFHELMNILEKNKIIPQNFRLKSYESRSEVYVYIVSNEAQNTLNCKQDFSKWLEENNITSSVILITDEKRAIGLSLVPLSEVNTSRISVSNSPPSSPQKPPADRRTPGPGQAF